VHACRGGLLVTTTNQWVSGSSEKVCVAAHGLGTSVDVTVRLQRIERTYRRREPGPPVIYSQASLVLPAGRSSLRCMAIAGDLLSLGWFCFYLPPLIRRRFYDQVVLSAILSVRPQPDAKSYARICMNFLPKEGLGPVPVSRWFYSGGDLDWRSLSFRGHSRPARSFRHKIDCSAETVRYAAKSITLIGSRMCSVQLLDDLGARFKVIHLSPRKKTTPCEILALVGVCALWVLSNFLFVTYCQDYGKTVNISKQASSYQWQSQLSH